MIRLYGVLIENVQEDVKADVKKSGEARAIVDYIVNAVDKWNGTNTNAVRVFPADRKIKVLYKDINVTLIGNINRKSPTTLAGYDPKSKNLYVWNVDMKKQGKKVHVSFDDETRSSLYHELIHYLDMTRQYKGSVDTLMKGYKRDTDKRGFAGYINNPLEFNAHFFEYFMPAFIEDLQKNRHVVKKPFAEFYKAISNSSQFRWMQNNLDPKYFRKMQKRIAALYQEFSKNPDEIQALEKINVDNLEQERKKHSWFDRLIDKITI